VVGDVATSVAASFVDNLVIYKSTRLSSLIRIERTATSAVEKESTLKA
jgi:hypothetical protein